MILLAIIVGVYIALFVTSPLIAIFHELGHALAHLILTKPGKIDIYIGSYGEGKKTIDFRIGKLYFHIKRTFPFVKGIGLCKSDKTGTDYIKRIVILLAGPVFTVVAAIGIGAIIFNTNAHGLIKLYCFAFMFFSIVSLYVNLRPRTIRNGKDEYIDNDGKQLLFTLKLKKSYADYITALQCASIGELELAILKLEVILKKLPGEEKILRQLISYTMYAKHYEKALFYLIQLEEKSEFSTKDILNKACMQSLTGHYEESLPNYRLVLKYDAENLTALNNLAYSLVERGEYEEAQQLLKKAENIDPQFYYTYGNLGYLKVLQGDLETGKSLIDKSTEFDGNNAYTYKALGVYYLKLKNADMANECFEKAVELDKRINLDSYNDEIKALSEQNSP